MTKTTKRLIRAVARTIEMIAFHIILHPASLISRRVTQCFGTLEEGDGLHSAFHELLTSQRGVGRSRWACLMGSTYKGVLTMTHGLEAFTICVSWFSGGQ